MRLFGRSTAAIDDYDGWLAMLDGLGLLTERAVLLDQCSVAQNLALPLTLEIEPIRADVLPAGGGAGRRGRHCRATPLDGPVRGADPAVAAARAAGAGAGARSAAGRRRASHGARCRATRWQAFARDLARDRGRGAAPGCSAISADREFVRALGGTALTLDPTSGVLTRPGLLARLGLQDNRAA